METQDFKVGWRVKIYDHRQQYWNGMIGKICMVKKYVVYVEIERQEDIVACLPHELIILDKAV